MTNIGNAVETRDVDAIVRSLSAGERKAYSYARAIRAVQSEKSEPCLELDLSHDLKRAMKAAQHGPQSIFVPLSTRSGLDTKSGAAGGYLAGTAVAPEVIQLLANKSLIFSLGAQLVGGLRSNLAMPKELTATSATWESEHPAADISDSDATFGQVVLGPPRTLMATTGYSALLLHQSDPIVERFVRSSLARVNAVALDKAAINGSGLENQPVGLLNSSGINIEPAGEAGAVPDWENIVNLELKVAQCNADIGSLAYLATPELRNLLKQTTQVSGGSEMIWQGNTMNGYPAQVSNNVPSDLAKSSSTGLHALVFGDWSQLVVGEWSGGMELVVDPYSRKKSAVTEVTSFLMADIAIREVTAFSALLDCKLA